MKIKYLSLVFFVIMLSSCGPIIGQLMRFEEGVKEFTIESGKLDLLKKGQKFLVVGPFEKNPEAYYIARGDDAFFFSREIDSSGFFKTQLTFKDMNADPVKRNAEFRAMTGPELKSSLGLNEEPDLLVFGTILNRSTIVAPTRGIIMEVGYRFEFYQPTSRESTKVKIVVREPFQDSMRRIVEQLVSKVR